MENKIHITEVVEKLNSVSPGFISTFLESGNTSRNGLIFRMKVDSPLVPEIKLEVSASGMVDQEEFENKIRSLLEECDLPEGLQKRLNIYKEKA